MLFDTSSPGRKRVLRVVYGLLALLFFVGFVGFGVGGNNSGGGILDALGITDSGGGSVDDQYSLPIDDAQAKLDKDPQNQRALLDLTRYNFLSAAQQIRTSDSGEVSSDAKNFLEDSVAAWGKYLKTSPNGPDKTVAAFAVQAYVTLDDANGAAKAQEIVAKGNPSAQAYYTLALYHYADFDFTGGDAAGKDAVSNAKGAKETKQVKKALAQLRTRAQKQAKASKAQAQASGDSGASGLADPFGPLQGSDPTGAGSTLGSTP